MQAGFWPSDLTAEQAVAASSEYGQAALDSAGRAYWVEFRPHEHGRNCICREGAHKGTIETLTPEGYSVRSRVHEYGGTSWSLLNDDRLVFVNAADQQLYLQQFSTGTIRAVTHSKSARYLEPVWDVRCQRIIVVEEHHASSGVDNRLVSISLDGECKILHEQHDFYTYPTLSPCCGQLAFIAWDHPYQPWTATYAYRAKVSPTGDLLALARIGDQLPEALSQPQFDAAGQLYLMTDQEGWWNLYRWETDGLTPKLTDHCDMIMAPWQAGLRHYGFSGEGGLCSVKLHHQGSELCIDGQALSTAFNHFRSLAVQGNRLVCVAGSTERLTAVIAIDLTRAKVAVLRGNEQPLAREDCALPQPLEFGADQHRCYGYLYQPANQQYSVAEQRPLVIFLHGGPTAATYPVFNLKIQFWTQRGFAVLDLNYRGSANYGRNYRAALQHQWGELEVADIRQAVVELVDHAKIDPQGIFIRGNSSGGYSALNAMRKLNCFAGGASLYGVTDPLLLNAATHKFESHYLSWLIGDPVHDAHRYQERAPVHAADQIQCPVIFFQGEQDAVVLASQTRSMVASLKAQGKPVEAHYFEEEAHGFRQAKNAAWVLERELAFYRRSLHNQVDI